MKQRPRIYYTEAQKALMWDRCKTGIDRTQVSVERIVSTQTTSWHPAPHEQAVSPALLSAEV